MSLGLLPPICELAHSGRFGDRALVVPFDRVLERDSRCMDLKRTVFDLASRWPRLAAAVLCVRASRRVSSLSYAEARICTFSTVGGHIEVSRSALKDPLLDQRLLGLHTLGESVGSTLADVLVHEWGHLVINIAVQVRYPKHFNVGQSDLVSIVEALSGVSAVEVAPELSRRATASNNELLAEAFTDEFLNASSAHSFSRALVEVLCALWPPPKPDTWPGWAV